MKRFIPEPALLDSPRQGRIPVHTDPATMLARTDALPERAEVVLVGAGPAGLAMASALWHAGVHDVVVLDAGGVICGQFFDRVDTLGQRVLRSLYDHHPGVEGARDCELLDFARLQWAHLTDIERREIRMAQAGHRSVVPLDVFEAFCRHVVALHDIAPRVWKARVERLDPADGQDVVVRTDQGQVRARSVVLCTGERRTPTPPTWWQGPDLPEGIVHWDTQVTPGQGDLVVVGAGLSAAHLISNALEQGRRVSWVVRQSAERYQCADVNASFFRVEGRARFEGTSWEDRLTLMGRERRASIMFEFRPRLEAAQASGQLTVLRDAQIDHLADGPAVVLADGTKVTGQQVVLALGTTPYVGADLLPPDVVGLRDGWPDIDQARLSYRKAPQVHVVGAAAGMVLGPAARNLDGHRVAVSRVCAALGAHLSRPSFGEADRSAEVTHV